jgi:hypothetical protein
MASHGTSLQQGVWRHCISLPHNEIAGYNTADPIQPSRSRRPFCNVTGGILVPAYDATKTNLIPFPFGKLIAHL